MNSSFAATALDRGDIRKNLTTMVSHWRPRIDEWKTTGKRHTEKSHAQQFWSDLLRCFGVIPERIDLFERDAARASTEHSAQGMTVDVARVVADASKVDRAGACVDDSWPGVQRVVFSGVVSWGCGHFAHQGDCIAAAAGVGGVCRGVVGCGVCQGSSG